jgi:predicted metal-dependent hydrolase
MTGLPVPIIALVGAAAWEPAIAGPLAAHGFRLARYPGQPNLVEWLVDQYTALVLVDADTMPHWRTRIARIKTDQSTRRIPIAVVAQSADAAPHSCSAGADGFLRADDLGADLLPFVHAHARLMTGAEREQLACQCAEPLPPLAERGVRKFNAGAFYAQHDAFEEQWMAEDGPVRELYRGVLQVGVAYYHITQGNYNGGLKMLRRSVQWLATLPDVCQGIDVRQLRADSARVRAALEAMAPDEIGAFDRDLLRPLRRVEG